MSTSDIKRSCAKTALVYLSVTISCALFGAIYERFSHGVYSYYMIYAFAIPLTGGVLPALLLSITGTKRPPAPIAVAVYHCAIATFTVGSIIEGILQIYGTTNALTVFYPIIGAALLLTACILQLRPPKP